MENATQKAGHQKGILQRRQEPAAFGSIIYVKPISPFKRLMMRSLLYIIAVVLVIGWILGFFVWSAPGLIHILLVLAVISFLFGIIRRA